MATPPAHVKLYGSSLPLGVWGGLGVLAIAGVIMWALPSARQLVGTGILAGVVIAGVLLALRRRSQKQDSPAAPLHLRD